MGIGNGDLPRDRSRFEDERNTTDVRTSPDTKRSKYEGDEYCDSEHWRDEAVALAEVLDVLTWRHVLEAAPPDDPYYKRPGQRVVIHPYFLSALRLVLATGNFGMDPQEGILEQTETWKDQCRPIILLDSDHRLDEWDNARGRLEVWMMSAKSVAVAGYRIVLEDGKDFCSS
jgi:hypothetical protein